MIALCVFIAIVLITGLSMRRMHSRKRALYATSDLEHSPWSPSIKSPPAYEPHSPKPALLSRMLPSGMAKYCTPRPHSTLPPQVLSPEEFRRRVQRSEEVQRALEDAGLILSPAHALALRQKREARTLRAGDDGRRPAMCLVSAPDGDEERRRLASLERRRERARAAKDERPLPLYTREKGENEQVLALGAASIV